MPANDNDVFQGRSPFKSFNMEAPDDWPPGMIDFSWWQNETLLNETGDFPINNA